MSERAKIYMESGSVVELVADKFTITKNNVADMVANLSWEGKVSPEPLYIDFRHVEAVVVEDVEEG